MGTWSGGSDCVPVARKGDLLKMPEVVDERHPRLVGNGARPLGYENDGLLGQAKVEKMHSRVRETGVYSPGPSPLPSPNPY